VEAGLVSIGILADMSEVVCALGVDLARRFLQSLNFLLFPCFRNTEKTFDFRTLYCVPMFIMLSDVFLVREALDRAALTALVFKLVDEEALYLLPLLHCSDLVADPTPV